MAERKSKKAPKKSRKSIIPKGKKSDPPAHALREGFSRVTAGNPKPRTFGERVKGAVGRYLTPQNKRK